VSSARAPLTGLYPVVKAPSLGRFALTFLQSLACCRRIPKRELLVRAVEQGAKKTQRSRLLPVSSRLAAVLDMAKIDPAGREYPPSAFVFGALGERVANSKKAWETCVLRAHGHEPRGSGAARCQRRRVRPWLPLTCTSTISVTKPAAGGSSKAGRSIMCRRCWGTRICRRRALTCTPPSWGCKSPCAGSRPQRGKSVAKEAQTEPPPLSHAQEEKREKGTLH
jgi:hypothetical protein